MDQIKIGQFIAKKRKAKGFTQKNLASKLDVSDKTISKWENGDRMPDVGLMLKLCSVLEITLNELLIGEEMDSDDFQKRADQNVINLLETNKKINLNRRKQLLGIGLGTALVTAAFIGMIFVVGGSRQTLFYLDYRTAFLLMGFYILLMSLTGLLQDYLRSFCIAMNIVHYEYDEIRKARNCIISSSVLLLVIAMIISVVAVVSAFGNISTWDQIGPALSQAVLSILYMLVMELVHVVCIQALHKKLLSYGI